MIVEFEDEELDRLEVEADFHAGYPPSVVRGFRKCLQAIRAAVDERDFYASKGLRYEKLRGNLQGLRSLRINKQMRLIVRIDEAQPTKKVVVLRIMDYH